MKKILVVDDEKPISDIIKFNMAKEGYEVLTAFDGKEALAVFEAENPDILILDLMLPEIDGLEVARTIRKTSNVPIIVLSAKDTEFDKVIGPEIGADDYVTKPFPMSVFQKKLAALLGRIAKQSGGECYDDGILFINFSEMTATLSGEAIIFTPLEYRLLKVLTKNPKVVLTRQVLLEKLWDIDGNFVDEHALTAAVSRVRNKIEADGQQYIKTVYGMGYMWIGGLQK